MHSDRLRHALMALRDACEVLGLPRPAEIRWQTRWERDKVAQHLAEQFHMVDLAPGERPAPLRGPEFAGMVLGFSEGSFRRNAVPFRGVCVGGPLDGRERATYAKELRVPVLTRDGDILATVYEVQPDSAGDPTRGRWVVIAERVR